MTTRVFNDIRIAANETPLATKQKKAVVAGAYIRIYINGMRDPVGDCGGILLYHDGHAKLAVVFTHGALRRGGACAFDLGTVCVLKKKQEARGEGMESICKSAKVVEVIEVKVRKGAGTESDPCRIVTEYHSLDGKLLAVADPEVKIFE